MPEVIYEKRKCDICGEEWDAAHYSFENYLIPTYYDNHIATHRRHGAEMEYRTYKACPKCVDRVLNFIDELWKENANDM